MSWQAGTASGYWNLSASRVFDIAANTTQTYFLIGQDFSGGTPFIHSPQLTAILYTRTLTIPKADARLAYSLGDRTHPRYVLQG